MSGDRCIAVVLLHVGLALAADWGYTGEEGPDHWADLEGSMCGESSQSPIDLVTKDTKWKDLGEVDLVGYSLDDEDAGVPSSVENNGHSLTVHLDGNYVLSGSGLPGKYTAVQFHFHWGKDAGRGSEHTLDGKQYDAEMHIVHYNSDKYNSFTAAAEADDSESLAVLGVFLEIGTENNEAFSKVFDLAPMVEYKDEVMDLENDTFSVADLLPDDLNTYYRYSGSLTTPTCNEIVIWTVFREVVAISQAQIQDLRDLHDGREEGSPTIGDNYRPVQLLNDRTVYYNGGPGTLTPAVSLMVVMVLNAMHYIY